MSKLFQATTVGRMELRNRFVRSATWEGLAKQDGSCTQALVNVIAELAKGEIGLIISSHAYVSPEGQAGPRQIAVYDDQQIGGLHSMVESAHANGSKIVLQLAHAGIQAQTALTNREAVGPSSQTDKASASGREMTEEEIEAVIEAFVQAARRGQEAGFDGVQIHAAHGFLLSQFLSPHYNHRLDKYGGTTRNRAQITFEILKRIKALLSHDFPVLIKMNSEDFLDDGMTVDEMLETASVLQEAGIDGIELSGGVNDPACHFSPVREGTPLTEEEQVYYRQAAIRYKRQIRVPLILVGGIRSYEVSEELVETGVADLISLCRPLIREPHLVARWKSGDVRASECLSCNDCFGPIRQGDGFYCVTVRALP